MKKDTNVQSGSGKTPLFCVAIFLLILTAMIMTVRTEKVYAAPGDVTDFKVEDPESADEWTPSVKISWSGMGSSGWIVACEESGYADTAYNNWIRDTETVFEAGKQYHYNIYYATDASKTASYVYTPDMSKFVPRQMTEASASASGKTVEISWPVINDLKVNIYQGTKKIATSNEFDEKYTISNLAYNTSYTFKVAYVNQAKEGTAQTVTVKTEPEPAKDSGSGDSGSGNSGSGDSGSGNSGSGGSSTFDSGGTIPILSKPTVFATKISSKVAVVRWWNVYDAAGYYVYQGKKKVKTVKALTTRVVIKRKGAGKAKFKVVAFAKAKGKTYKSPASKAVKPKANRYKRSIAPNPRDYELLTCKFIVSSIKLSGKTYTVTGYAMNNRVWSMPKYKRLSIALTVDGKKAFSKKYKNKKVGVKAGSKKKLVFKIKGKPNMDLANGAILLSVHGTATWPKASFDKTHTW